MLAAILNWTKKNKSWLFVLSIIVVFCTTYALILPAITLEEKEAAQQGGIDVASEEQDASDASEQDVAGELSFEGDGYSVTAACDAEAGLPLQTELSVTPIDENDQDYDAYCDEALAAIQAEDGGETVKELKFAYFYDISLMADGAPVEPEAPVDVAIFYDKALRLSDAQNLRIVHFGVDKKGNPKTEVLDPKNVDITAKAGKGGDDLLMTEAGFKTESFSVFAVVYTVDFHYAVDGQTFDYSIEGGSSIQLSELLAALSIEISVEDISDVTFSNPELIGITQDDGDWTLKSLEAFDTEETLIITMKNGEQFEVRVTDAQYDGSLVTNLNGATGALVNKTNNNVVLGIARNSTSLQSVGVTVNGNQISTADGSPDLTQWTFNYSGRWNGNDYYTIRCAGGYLNLGSSSATLSSTSQNLIVVSRQQNGETQIRIANDNHDALNNTNNVTGNGYSTYNNWNYDTNPGEWFTVYQLSYPNDPWNLDGKSLAIINNRDGGSNWQALRDEIDDTKDGRGYYMSGNGTSYSSENGVDYSSSGDVRWTFEFVSSDSSGSYYRIRTSNGYLFIDPNVTKKSDMPSGQSHNYEHALRLESSAGDGSASDGTLIRIVSNGDGTYLLQNRNGVCLWNYGNNEFWLSTLTQDGESQTSMMNSRFRLAQQKEVNHVTVHYVDRNGNPLTGVQYTGGNNAVIQNQNGTFTIPYDISGNIDLRANFNFNNVIKGDSDPAKYTYANTHLAGDGDYSALTYNGYLIDSQLTSTSGGLQIHTDSGETVSGNTDPGNRAYGALGSYSLTGTIKTRPTDHTSQIPYAQSPDKDIYVILDPLPGEHAASPISGNEIDAEKPKLTKTMVPNNDGTYTLKLTVDAHAKDASKTNKANVLFIVDTSSSMRNPTTNGSNRIIDTHNAVLDFGQQLLAYNNTNTESVEVAMIAFDGGVYERLDWTDNSTTFTNTVNNYLRYYYMHQGTDWEDSMKAALDKVLHDTDDDPTFVVFFTDGEPSQYTSFSGAGENTKNDYGDPLNGNSFAHEWDSTWFSYPNYYSYFLSREGSKDEMRAIVDSGAQLYGIYAYNSTNDGYTGYNGKEDGAKMLHNAIKYGYNTDDDLTNNLFYEAKNTNDLKGAFDKIFNLITEKVGFSNVVVKDGITSGVTSSTVIDGDVSGFTYTIKNKAGNVAYKVTVAPNGVPAGTTVADGTPIFTIGSSGPPHVGEIKRITTTKFKTDEQGNPVTDASGNIQTEEVEIDVYYYKEGDNEYIMPISSTGNQVTWDLSPLGILKDGYSYEVSFVVWPNQDAYDLVADLNNGKRPDIEATANWNNCELKTDSAGRQYRQGGFSDYPYISRYEDNGVYSAMSNTDQKIDYYKIDQKIVDGQEVTEITKGSTSVPPPDPMPLTSSYSRIEKLWNVERDPGIFAQYLYNTDGTSKQFTVNFDVFQGDNFTTPYTNESLGWDPAANNGQGGYVWAPGDTLTNVTYAGHPHQIGTRWVTDFAIATGLMLTEGEMQRLGLNKGLYPSTEYEGETYYILEPGHDYTIKEHIPEGEDSNIGYEFDFISPVYHPMLVDGILKNVEVKYTYKTVDGKQVIDTATISSITGSDAGLSGLEVQNTLRGYINLNKIVVDEAGEQVKSDDTKFEYTIKLESPTTPGPFEGDHIPWYGVNGLFYNNGHENYYQVYEAQGGVWMIKNEAGREYVVTNVETGTGSAVFNPDEAGAQTVTYEVNGQPKQVTLYGNQMTASANGTIATANLAITQNETLYIANVPVGTTYTITEADTDEYTLTDILKQVKNGTAVEQSEHVTDLSGRTATGTIVTNRDNHVTYTNKVLTGALKITKEIQKNGTTDTSATGTFYYAVYDEEYDPNADPAQEPVRTGSIEVTTGGTAEITESDLKVGKYYVYELTGEGGSPVTSGGVFNGGKYYTVTTTGSPATVALGGTSTAGIVNNYETVPITATKSWADNNPQRLTIYFKLFYQNAAGVAITTGTALKPLAPGVTSVTWDDMPKYDENGNEYNYIVREYILDDQNGEFEEGGHKYMEAAPNGYVNTEAGLSVTNSKIETYEPVTTYSGLKVWVDTVNGSMTRPDGLIVTLMIDKEPYDNPAGDEPVLGDNGENLVPDWVTVGDNQWRYTFTKLPMFDEEKNIIRYYAVETPAEGYDDSITNQKDTEYAYVTNTLGHTTNDAYPSMNSDADLVFTAVRITPAYEGHIHHIWTQRVPTAQEKTRLIALVNSDLISRNFPGDATVDNVRWVSGLPIDHEFLYSPTSAEGYKIAFTWDDRTPPQPNTIHVDVRNHNKFDNICYGTLQYNYTAGSTDFKNELQPVSHNVEKTWGDGVTPPEGAVVNVQLQGTIQREVDPQPEGATETVYEAVPIDLASVGVTQKIQVTLNGGAQDGDDTTQDPWKYTWSNLPPCDKAGNEITYSVKEISYTVGGHTVNLKDFEPGVDTCIWRRPTAGFAEQNGRDAERAAAQKHDCICIGDELNLCTAVGLAEPLLKAQARTARCV